MNDGAQRRERLAASRLYLVVESVAGGRPAEPIVAAALEGGADLVQLRDKEAGDDSILEAAARFRELCAEHGALFVLNDRADLAARCGADAVHVGQDDARVEEARAVVGPDLLIGLSTHAPGQFAAGLESGADYLCAGPVHETPTKPGRPATGLGYVRHAAAHADGRPWFAIGGIDTSNVAEVAEAGAGRVVVVRAIRDADDPRAVARELRTALETGVGAAR
ncbi:MAG: thiamine phosphate synthase [Thermoleophilaceae bacterium]